MADIKPGIKPEIKPELHDGKVADVDDFDDDTDLHIPAPGSQAWLVKLPKDMWQAWNDIYTNVPDDDRVLLGSMRVYHPKHGEDESKQKIQIRLLDQPQHDEIPKNYDLKLTTTGYSNAVVFSEKDLPGHRAQPYGRNRPIQQSKPAGIPVKSERYGSTNKDAPTKSTRATYRTAIPKQTSLAPIIHHEANATPIEDDAYYDLLKQKWDAHVAPKSRTVYIEGVDHGMHPGMSNLSTFNSFGLSARPGRGGVHGQSGLGNGRKKIVKDKATRMPQAQLIDALYVCFRRYKYWSMKALRSELRQPEAWIKENLEGIASLMRSGDFAMNWVLRPEYAGVGQVGSDVKDEVAKVESGMEEDDTGEEEFEDDPGEFEDVKMGGS